MKKVFFFSLLFVAFCTIADAQQRYVKPVFSQVSTTTVDYGSNFTIMPVLIGAHPARQALKVKIYTPVGDTETERPLIIYLKTGGFLPFPVNGSCGGTIDDSSNVAFAIRLAQMGYVVAVADYRIGWNPIANNPAPVQLTRRYGFINAVYRGVQDVRTCIRYFRKSVAEQNNLYGIDPTKIIVWGQGTGGYLSMAAAYLNAFDEIYNTADPNKFVIPVPGVGAFRMIHEKYNGDLNGNPPTDQDYCLVDAPLSAVTGGFLLPGDTLCKPNHVGYSSEFHLAVNMGGALCDSSWMDPGEMPLISYHVLFDPFTPCGTGEVVPSASTPILEVSGSCDLQKQADQMGLNEEFDNIFLWADPMQPFSEVDRSGFFAFGATPNNTESPWEWTTSPPAPANCNFDGTVARTYIDTIIRFFVPRACFALNLPCDFVSTKNLPAYEVSLEVAPVPTTNQLNFNAKETIRAISVYDISGRIVRTVNSIDSNTYTLDRQTLANGLYIAEIRFDKGAVRRKVIFE